MIYKSKSQVSYWTICKNYERVNDVKTFFQKVDKRSREAMVGFLKNHFRYHTMNSWNQSTSYANCLKIHSLGLESDIVDKLYEMIEIDSFYWEINNLIHQFNSNHNYQWQCGFNGRSSGYLVLYTGGCKISEYKSYCLECGQRNYKLVPPENPSSEEQLRVYANLKDFWTDEVIYKNFVGELPGFQLSKDKCLEIIRDEKTQIRNGKGQYTETNRCGKCGSNSRVNYDESPVEVFSYPGRSVDMGEDFNAESWSMEALRERVNLVQEFDQLCDKIVSIAYDMAKNNIVEEEVIMVPKTVKKLRHVGA